MFTGSVNRNVGCSGSWLAHHEYVVEDVNKWSFLAHSGRIAGATSIDTHGQLSRSTRFQSQAAYGFGDELRVSLVVDGIYWGAAAFLRRTGRPWFTEADVKALIVLAPAIAAGLRRSMLAPVVSAAAGQPGRLRAGSRRLRRERPAGLDLGRRGPLDRCHDRGPAAGPSERVEDGAGHRRARPVDTARHRPARTRRPSPGSYAERDLAAACTAPASAARSPVGRR